MSAPWPLDFGTCRRVLSLSGDGTVRRHVSQAQLRHCRGSGYEPVGVMRGEG